MAGRKINDNLDLAGNQITQVLLENLASDPGTFLGDGRVWYDTVLDAFRGRVNGVTVSFNTAVGITTEEVQDIAGAMTVGGTESGITVSYDDTNGRLDFTVTDSPLLGGQNSAYHLARANHTGTQAPSTIQVSATDRILGRDTAGAGAAEEITPASLKTMLAYNGTEIVFTPAGNIASVNVSAAISELESDMTALISTTLNAQKWKDPVHAATTGALPSLTYNSGAGTLTATANAALAAQDGVTLIAGEFLLVKDQASTFQNGVYVVTQVGSGAAPFILTRRADGDSAVELRDAAVMVEGGTTQGGDVYTQTVSALADLTAATQTWAKTGDTNTVYTADGTTLELIGNSFRIKATAAGSGLTGGGGAALDVNVGTGLEISADAVRIAAAAAGNGLTGGAGSALAVGAGVGISVAADAVAVDHAVVPMLYAVTLTGGATSEVITHGLGTRDVIVRIYLVGGTFAEEEFSVEHTSTTTCTIRSSITIPAATYRVVVLG